MSQQVLSDKQSLNRIQLIDTYTKLFCGEIFEIPSKDWMELNHELREIYSVNGQLKFKATMQPALCDYIMHKLAYKKI